MEPRRVHRLSRLFGFAHVLHMSPRDVDALTVEEYDHLAAGLDMYLKSMREAQSRAEAGRR